MSLLKKLVVYEENRMAKIVDLDEMLANQYEPLRRYRWYLSVDGVDAFLLGETNDETRFDEIEKNMETTLILHDPVAPNAAQRFISYIQKFDQDRISEHPDSLLELKMCDPLGNMIEKIHIEGYDIININLNPFPKIKTLKKVVEYVKLKFCWAWTYSNVEVSIRCTNNVFRTHYLTNITIDS